MEEIFKRLVIVSDSVFSQIVNSNLEVRTSVSIDPTTGAAEERALFTYEAIPRATILYFDVVYQKPEHFGLSVEVDGRKDIEAIIATVETGFELFEYLGVGGMGTRGFGKLRVLGLDKKLNKIQLNKIQSENLLNKIRKLEEEVEKVESTEEKERIQGEIQKLKEEIEATLEEYKELVKVWGEACKEVGRV